MATSENVVLRPCWLIRHLGCKHILPFVLPKVIWFISVPTPPKRHPDLSCRVVLNVRSVISISIRIANALGRTIDSEDSLLSLCTGMLSSKAASRRWSAGK